MDRRQLLCLVSMIPVAAASGGCESKAGKVVVAVAKRLMKIGNVAVDWVNLVLEIRAIIDGKDETIEAHLTKEEAEVLRNGGQLVIKSEDGTELPVEYRPK